ncbi:MAG: gamma-glutamyltransferase family protein [Alphaproteobacteria bacterium]|nr:gamma-glutamyltransferase family protein [Alphaproteobacteria bacterium]
MFTTRPEIVGTFGVVASTHWMASSAGMGILETGGNAFDAAAATAFVLQVVEPHMNGPAGDVPIIVCPAESNEVKVICGQGPSPAGATIAHFEHLGLSMIPGTGLLAAVVPGAFDGWMLMLREFGSLPLAEVLAPAIGYARNGFPVIPPVHDTIEGVEDLFRDDWPTSAAIYLRNDGVPEIGAMMRNEQLADTYARIVEEAAAAGGDRVQQIEAARKAWSQGFVADAIDRFVAETEVADSSGERHKGVLTGADMSRWQASIEAPLTYDYEAGGHTYTICKTGPWGQGPILLQQLALLKGFDVDGMDPLGEEFVHTITECAKLAFADREAFYGDPDFVDVPMETLLSAAYNKKRRKLVGTEASLELRPGTVPGYDGRIAPYEIGEPLVSAGGLGLGEPTRAEVDAGSGDTCHIDVIDRHGNMVSAMPSGGWLQSSPAIPGLGFALGTRGQMFWLEEGLPATLQPGKRPRTTLSPSFALRDGEPYMAFGTPGGDGQDQWPIAFFLRHVHHGMNLQEAIDAPAFFNENHPNSFYPRRALPGRLSAEGRFAEETLDGLRDRGHDLEVVPDWSLGRLSAATRENGVLKAGANPRGMQGYAVGR